MVARSTYYTYYYLPAYYKYTPAVYSEYYNYVPPYYAYIAPVYGYGPYDYYAPLYVIVYGFYQGSSQYPSADFVIKPKALNPNTGITNHNFRAGWFMDGYIQEQILGKEVYKHSWMGSYRSLRETIVDGPTRYSAEVSFIYNDNSSIHYRYYRCYVSLGGEFAGDYTQLIVSSFRLLVIGYYSIRAYYAYTAPKYSYYTYEITPPYYAYTPAIKTNPIHYTYTEV